MPVQSPDALAAAGADPTGALALALGAVLLLLCLASLWRLFQLAGEPGWAVLVPFYNLVVALRIARVSRWWLLPMLVPYVGVLAFLPLSLGFARRFGRGRAFAVGLWLLPMVFFPLLAVSTATGSAPQVLPAQPAR